MQALSRLKNMQLGVKTSYKISYIADHVERHVKQGREIFGKIAKKYAELDEKGNLKPQLNDKDLPIPGTFIFKSDEDRESFDKEQEEFMNIEHEINKTPFSIDELGEVHLSANDISALKPLFSDLD